MTRAVTATFALPAGGVRRVRVLVPETELVSIYARGSISRVITQATRQSKRHGVKLGTCLRIERRGELLFDYQLDTSTGFR